MPVKHDLYADLNITRDEMAKHRKHDPKLNHLVDEYEAIDAQIVEAESASAQNISDDQLKKLKDKRVQAKDKIAERVVSPAG